MFGAVNQGVCACRGEWLALTKQEIAAVLPGSDNTLETLSRVAQEAEERAPEMHSLESAWRVRRPALDPGWEGATLHRVTGLLSKEYRCCHWPCMDPY